MIKSVEEYLRQLKKELAGCDRATIQDALSDAEEYLRNTLETALETRPDLAEADALLPIIEKYGAPGEIAAAYKEIESRTPPAFARPVYKESEAEVALGVTKPAVVDTRPFYVKFFGIFADPKAWGALFYLLFFALFSGIIYFTWAVTGISLSLGLIVLIIGLPFIGLFVLSVQGIALIEGRVVEALLGVRMPRRPIFPGKSLGWWGRFKALISEKHTWLSIVYMILQLPLGIIYFVVFIVLIALSLFGIALPILEQGFDIYPMVINNVTYHTPVWILPLTVIAGILLIVLTMHLAKVMGRMHGALAKALLVRY
jgi:hypothetical protein